LTALQASGWKQARPQEMRAASYNFETYSSFFDVDLTDVQIYDAGDLEVMQP